MSLVEISQFIHDEDSAVQFLRAHQAIRRQPPRCRVCPRLMTEVRGSGGGGGMMWRCPKHKGQKLSLRDDSFWAKSRLSLQQLISVAWTWAFEFKVDFAAEVTGIDRVSVMTWYGYLRETCSTQLINNPIQIGGPGVVVQIDETLMARRKNNVGHLVEQRWVFGGYCPVQNVGFLQFVPNRNAATLLPIIQQFIAPGSIIHSDMWGAYNNIANLPVVPAYTHLTVNHTRNFVDPVTGAHTNHVECYWKNAKIRMKAMCGVLPEQLPSHLDEFMWRQRYGGKSGRQVFNVIMDHIAIWYPTP